MAGMTDVAFSKGERVRGGVLIIPRLCSRQDGRLQLSMRLQKARVDLHELNMNYTCVLSIESRAVLELESLSISLV